MERQAKIAELRRLLAEAIPEKETSESGVHLHFHAPVVIGALGELAKDLKSVLDLLT